MLAMRHSRDVRRKAAFSVSGRYWVHHGGQGGRAALLEGFDEAIKAIPASLDLSAPE